MNEEHSTIAQITIMERDDTWMNQLVPPIYHSHLSHTLSSLIPPSHCLCEHAPHDAVHNKHHLSSRSPYIENSSIQTNQSPTLSQHYPVLQTHTLHQSPLHRVISLWNLFVSRIIWSFLRQQGLRLVITSYTEPYFSLIELRELRMNEDRLNSATLRNIYEEGRLTHRRRNIHSICLVIITIHLPSYRIHSSLC